ncbi:MAG TPA: ArsA family ATPase [Longimicrobiales bacterium]|nr:ArsA family ATPase [Longimicrobiales bacterium]
MALLLRPVTFLGGKGGVGKTTLAAAAALASADAGARTLLVSTDPAHSAADVLDRPVGAEPTRVATNLDAMEVDPDTEADRYIAGVKERVREVTSPGMLAAVEREVDIARASPGAHEAALFDRVAELMALAGHRYDRVIFDTAPTGHTLRLLGLPELMEAWVEGLLARRRKVNALERMWRRVAPAEGAARAEGTGASRGPARRGSASAPTADDPAMAALERRQRRFRDARRIVTDPERAAFIFVLAPERLPILETGRAVEALERYGIPVGGVITNRVLPANADGEFLARRRAREGEYLSRIDQAFAHLPRTRVALREADPVGVAALREVAGEVDWRVI